MNSALDILPSSSLSASSRNYSQILISMWPIKSSNFYLVIKLVLVTSISLNAASRFYYFRILDWSMAPSMYSENSIFPEWLLSIFSQISSTLAVISSSLKWIFRSRQHSNNSSLEMTPSLFLSICSNFSLSSWMSCSQIHLWIMRDPTSFRNWS